MWFVLFMLAATVVVLLLLAVTMVIEAVEMYNQLEEGIERYFDD